MNDTASRTRTILIAGASRGLGLGLTRAFLDRGWRVVATARDPDAATPLASLSQGADGRLSVEALDVTDRASVASLAARLPASGLDGLLVVAGISSSTDKKLHEVDPDDAAREFHTNAMAPTLLAHALEAALAPGATVAFLTSRLGSIAMNEAGGYELYRGTKAALNMFAKTYALQHRDRPVLLLHPGWVRTDMGGPNAPLDVGTSVRGMVEVIERRADTPGLAYLDYEGKALPGDLRTRELVPC